MIASRSLTAPYPPLPEWRKEFGNSYVLRDFTSLQQRTNDAVEGWPRELSTPLIKNFNAASHSVERPMMSHQQLQPIRDAVAFAESIARELKSLRLEMVSGDVELCELASRCAQQCQQYPMAAEWIVRRIGLDPPDGKHMTGTGKMLRMQCVRWWRRRMRAHFGQAVENAMRARGYVRKGKAAYCTDWALRRRTSQRVRTNTMLQSAVAINEDGEQLSLFDAAQASVSNPVNRRHELMTRIRGFEEIATECGHIAIFGTLTAPGFFHAQHSGGGENAAYARQGRRSVKAAQLWQCERWAIARSRLHKAGVEVYGFRIAEPHHDGTPHWHLLLFMKKEHAWIVKWILRAVWCIEYADEKGASKYRCNFKKINPMLGDAAGYIAKYVAKNIDGFEVGNDYEAGGESKTTAHRVDAWASTHRIRQFQQIGGAPVGIWRELRKAQPGSCYDAIESARMCADAGDWRGFNAHAAALSLWKETTGECNAYREVKQPCVVGVQSGPHTVRTRIHEWRINWSNGNGSTGIFVTHGRVLRSGSAGVSVASRESGSGRVRDMQSVSSVSDSGAQRPLGPVSITVRSDENRYRESGKFIYPHAGRWFMHQAISIARAPPVKIDPHCMHPYSVQRNNVSDKRSTWGPLPHDHLKPAKYQVPR